MSASSKVMSKQPISENKKPPEGGCYGGRHNGLFFWPAKSENKALARFVFHVRGSAYD
jgi:hypothetical protein